MNPPRHAEYSVVTQRRVRLFYSGQTDGHSPIVQPSSRVLAALHFDHEERKEQEEHGHAKANTVHSLVTNQHVTVHVTLNTGDGRAHPSFTEPWDLQGLKQRFKSQDLNGDRYQMISPAVEH